MKGARSHCRGVPCGLGERFMMSRVFSEGWVAVVRRSLSRHRRQLFVTVYDFFVIKITKKLVRQTCARAWEKLTWVGHRPARIILLFMFTYKNVCAQARDPLCTKLAGAHLFARLLHRDESTTKMGQASSLGSLAVSPSSCEESRRCSFSLPSLVLPILHTVEEL